MGYVIRKKAREIEFGVETGFIIAFGFAVDNKIKLSNYSGRRYTIVIPFFVFEINTRKYGN